MFHRLAIAASLCIAVPAAAGEPVDWIATGAFGDIAARAGWRPVTDWVFDEGSDTPRAVPGAGVLLDANGEARDLYTIAAHADLEISGEFLLAPGSHATLRFLGRYDLRFGERRGRDLTEPVVGDPGTILGARPGEGRAPRLAIDCAPRVWHRFSATLRAPRFDVRGVRIEPARLVRVVLDGIVLQVDATLDAPSAGAPEHEIAEGPFALRSGGGPVAYRRILARPLSLVAETAEAAQLARVVVFSRTVAFRHESIPAGIAALRELGGRHGFAVDATEDPTELLGLLDGASVVVFLNTTGDVLDDGEQRAFESAIESGGGFVGIHSAADTEYEWPWYGRLVGAWFAAHPPVQLARVLVVDRAHPATAMLPETWPRTDEWYDFRGQPEDAVRILATLDPESYAGSSMGQGHPICWCREIGRGRAFYTGGGHTAESFAEPLFRAHLLGALRWAAGDDRLDPALPESPAPAAPAGSAEEGRSGR
jgi:type 1 glutamine amidotransferase